jgi:hypothetical protein
VARREEQAQRLFHVKPGRGRASPATRGPGPGVVAHPLAPCVAVEDTRVLRPGVGHQGQGEAQPVSSGPGPGPLDTEAKLW